MTVGKKKAGYILCIITGVSRGWLDAKCAKTGREITLLFKYEPSQKLLDFFGRKKECGGNISICCLKTGDENIYAYLRFSYAAKRDAALKATARVIERESLQREVSATDAPVRSNKGMKEARGACGFLSADKEIRSFRKLRI